MVRIVFIVLGVLSAGELTIAVEFARRLNPGKYRILFLVPGKFDYVLENHRLDYLALDPGAGAGKNREKIFRMLKAVRPDLVVISDSFTMENSSHWSGLKFADLKESGVPVVGVDEYEYASTGYRVDYYGLHSEKLPPLVDACDFQVRNCPLNSPKKTAGKVKCYSFLGKRMKLGGEQLRRARERLGIAPNEKMIFYATSKWETINMHKILALTSFLKWRPTIVERYLEHVRGKIVLVHVGPKPMGSDLRRARCINLENVAPAEFESYLLSSDLFITFNIVSVTLSKAVFGEVPCLVFQNEKVIDFRKLQHKLSRKPGWYQDMAREVKVAYAFKASTFGWHRFLEPVLKDNDYLETFERVPFFKMDAAVSGLEELLFNPRARARLREKQAGYIESILKLPAPHQVVEEILDEVKHVNVKGNE